MVVILLKTNIKNVKCKLMVIHDAQHLTKKTSLILYLIILRLPYSYSKTETWTDFYTQDTNTNTGGKSGKELLK